ncbi:MAG: hypothetical protein ACRDSF_26300 [Pseudonocardiaceae bacterium]
MPIAAEEFLHSRVVREWGLAGQPRSDAGAAPDRDSGTRLADPDATEVLPRIEPDVGDLSTQPLQTPAVSPTPRFPAGRPDLDHGGAGEHPGHDFPPPCGRSAINQPRGDTHHARPTLRSVA